MKKVKWAFIILILVFVALTVFQNWQYFNEKQQLSIDLQFHQYVTPEFPNWFFSLTCFAVGLLAAYLYGLIEKYKSKKMIKKLNATTAAQHGEINGLKRELEMLQSGPVESDSAVTVTSGNLQGVSD